MLNPREIKKFRSLLKREDERMPIVFAALGDAKRCKIFRSFLKRERLCVSDVARTFGISMSLASQHLKMLEVTGLLSREKDGRTVYFRPRTDDKLVAAIIRAVK